MKNQLTLIKSKTPKATRKEILGFIVETYIKEDRLGSNPKFLEAICDYVTSSFPKICDIQELQNFLRDCQDEDPKDNDAFWYLVIDAISASTGIQP
jgi:hypothetical protein